MTTRDWMWLTMRSWFQRQHAALGRLSTATMVNIGGMLVAIAGIVVQIAAGVDYPTVPPGPIVLGLAVALVALARRPWVPVVGVVVPAFLLTGGTIAAIVNDDNALRDPGDVVAFAATVLQMAAVVVALVAGVRAQRSSSTG